MPALRKVPALRNVVATRYVTPLREGGSLPGLIEADDLGTYVVKFTGAGQGRKALIADIVGTSLARSLGLPVAELVIVDVDPALAANEPDEEVQDLLRASPGRNLGVDFLPGALDLDTSAFPVDPQFAGRVLWLDALIANVDRSWRNPNLLFWHRRPYLIDHGAALTFHHNWAAFDAERVATRPYDAGEHALITSHPDLDAADAALAPMVTATALDGILALVPDGWLRDEPGFDSPAAVRIAYRDALLARVAARGAWLPSLRAMAEQGGARRVPVDRNNRPSWVDRS